MSNTCPNCSAAIDADAVFCTACGNPVSQTILCPKCRGTITADAKFCKFCAFDLSLQVPTTTADLPPITNPPIFAAPPTMAMPIVPLATPVVPATPPVIQTSEQEDKRSFITPSAAGFAVICFFLPWIEYSCGGFGGRSLSGSDLASLDNSLWLIPLAAIAIIGAFFFFRSQKKLFLAIPVTMGAVAFALFFLLYKAQAYGRGIDTPFGGLGYDMLGFSLQFGGFLTAISFLAAWLGCWFLLPASNTPNQILSSNKVAALCYLLFPLPYLTWLIAPLIFIFKDPYKTDKFVRFHAIQSILLGLFHIAVSILIAAMVILPDLTKPAYARGGNSSAVYLLSVFLATGFIALAGFLAYKAATNKATKLVFLGDLAAKLVDKEINFPNVKN